uniref:Uncharacterized protein n=1 Tax=Strigamia maritima TaxID=126957 RepID=T1JMU0_STRMM
MTKSDSLKPARKLIIYVYLTFISFPDVSLVKCLLFIVKTLHLKIECPAEVGKVKLKAYDYITLGIKLDKRRLESVVSFGNGSPVNNSPKLVNKTCFILRYPHCLLFLEVLWTRTTLWAPTTALDPYNGSAGLYNGFVGHWVPQTSNF